MSKREIYLDYNASTPISPEVAEAMRPYLVAHFGNPSSSHWAGRPPREAVERARQQVADFLGCRSVEVVFTSGGSEANNHALKGIFFAHRDRSTPHIITTQIEHPSIIEPCHFLEQLGAEVTYLPVDTAGRVDPDNVRAAIRPETIIVSVMHANNEVGTIQPIEAIAEITREHGILFHSDAAQSAGKIAVDVNRLGVDLLSLAGHKFYAPKGIGALYIRQGTELASLIHGASHEKGRRAGTENVLLVVGLGAAAETATEHLPNTSTKVLRDYFWQRLKEVAGTSVVINGHPDERLPNTLNVGFRGRDARMLLNQLDGLAASTGSACHADRIDMSPVLAAMKVPEEVAMGSIRFSLGRFTTQAETDDVVERIYAVISKK